MKTLKDFNNFINESIEPKEKDKLKSLIRRNKKNILVVDVNVEKEISQIGEELNRPVQIFTLDKMDPTDLFVSNLGDDDTKMVTNGNLPTEGNNSILYFNLEGATSKIVNMVYSLIFNGYYENYTLPVDCAVVCSITDTNGIESVLLNKMYIV